jgi:murein endopeptidase
MRLVPRQVGRIGPAAARPAGRRVGRGAGPLLAVLLLAMAAAAEPERDSDPVGSSEGQIASVPPSDSMQQIGSISVGHPHAGYLFNGVRMPAGQQWILSAPDLSWGTRETIDALIHCIRRVNEQYPDSPRVIIGAISAQGGGPLPPHKSHRTGRDVDVHFYLTRRTPKVWYEPATRENLDRARNWALLRALITETDVEMVLIDRSVQALLEEYALSVGEPAAWVQDIFHGGPTSSSLIKHVPGHTGHMHIRFVSPVARRRGCELYDQLVRQGHIQLPTRELLHEVASGDTLLRLAHRYGVEVEQLQRLNGLESTVIKVGQTLKVHERVDIRGARDQVLVPPRRLPQVGPGSPVEHAGNSPETDQPT